MKRLFLILSTVAALAGINSSCSSSTSYAELLTSESHYVNNYLADHRVTNTIPTDTTFEFEVGEDAPYYRMDEDGNVYMQVVKAGTRTADNYAKDNEVIFFRFTRYDLSSYADATLPEGEGNEVDMSYLNAWFRMNNFTLESSYQWGAGIQLPLSYLPIDCEVNLVIKSQYGLYDEMSYVTPYLYHVRYYRQLT
jgi:hypothetical protein